LCHTKKGTMEIQVTHNNLPDAISRLLAKVEGLERKLAAAIAPPPQKPDYVTIQEAQEILRGTLAKGSIYNLKSQGKLAATKVGRKLLFKRSDIEAMLKDGYQPTAAEQDAAIQAEVDVLLTDSVKRNKTMKP